MSSNTPATANGTQAPPAAATPADLSDVSIQAPIVASHNKYLEEQTASFRGRTIPWEGYLRANIITADELAQIRQFEKSPANALAEAGERYVFVFLSLLAKLNRNDMIQNLLVLIDDILMEGRERAQLFFATASVKGDPSFPYAPFVKEADGANFDPNDFFVWITAQLQGSNPAVVDIVVQYLQTLLSINSYRALFFKTPNAVATLMDILRKNTDTQKSQIQYQIVYCLWLMSFVKEVSADIQRRYDILSVSIDIAKAAIKEKVVRVIVALWKNMISQALKENLLPMVGNKVLTVCENLSARKYSDTEITDDLEYLKEELAKHVQSLSTWDEYESEIRSGKLDWSPPHMSEQFWKQNAQKLADRDGELIRLLSQLIATSTNPVALAVAAHDVGQFVKHHPKGKK
ncbi:H(+)-transporting V1 sector ATPase subunit H [Quaeritorhiza haematococci]|nr:H(+)-transporting V1 sector ATPase subunit H [Quaeritorhiza haematococci]